MNYQIQPGDTFLSIASNLTLSGAYATALMELPENEGQASDVTENLTGRGVVSIPDSWLKPTVQNTGSTTSVTLPNARQPLPDWLPIAFIAAIVLMG